MSNPVTTPAKSRELSTPDTPFSWLRNEVERLFNDVQPGRSIFNFGAQLAPLPAIELADKGKEYQLTAEVPGLTEDDIEITVAEGVLTLSGEKREEADREEEGIAISERRYGSFSRQLRLPADVDPDKISAEIKKGVLTLTMAKDEAAAARARKIAITKG